MAFATAVAAEPQEAERVTEFTLANGLQVVVIPDHRAPVVTQMIWYKAGAADEPPGSSGIAHFLEHLMFKGTDKIPTGQFSKIIARNGGDDNAFTNHDVTAYFQRVAKDRLATVMALLDTMALDGRNCEAALKADARKVAPCLPFATVMQPGREWSQALAEVNALLQEPGLFERRRAEFTKASALIETISSQSQFMEDRLGLR